MHCALSVVFLTALFKDEEQKVGLSVPIPALNALQDSLVLWEMSLCAVIGVGGKYGRKGVCTVFLKIRGWAGTGRLSRATFISPHAMFAWGWLSIFFWFLGGLSCGPKLLH